MDTVNRVLFQYPIRRLIVGTRKVSKLRDLYLELFDRSGNCQAPRQHCCRCACQISKRCDDLNYQSCGFDTSCDFTIRRLMRYWYVTLVPSPPTCTVYWGVLKVTWYLLMQYFSKTSVQLWPPVIIFSGLVSCDIGLVYACAFRKAAGRIWLNMQSIREGREVHLQFRSTKRSLSKYVSNIWIFPGNQNLLQANILLFNNPFRLTAKTKKRKRKTSDDRVTALCGGNFSHKGPVMRKTSSRLEAILITHTYHLVSWIAAWFWQILVTKMNRLSTVTDNNSQIKNYNTIAWIARWTRVAVHNCEQHVTRKGLRKSLQWRHNGRDGVSNHQTSWLYTQRFVQAQIK